MISSLEGSQMLKPSKSKGGGVAGPPQLQRPTTPGGAGVVYKAPGAPQASTPFTMNAPGAPGPAAPATATPMPQLSLPNFAQTNPQMDQAWNDYQKRKGEVDSLAKGSDPLLQEQVENLRKRLGSDNTQAMKDRSATDIAAVTAGLKARQKAAGGGKSSVLGTRDAGALDEASGRQTLRAMQDVDFNDQARKDNLVLGGQGIMGAQGNRELNLANMANQFNLAGMGLANTPAQLALDQQRLGLQQFGQQSDNAFRQADLAQRGQQNNVDNYMRMLQTFGRMF